MAYWEQIPIAKYSVWIRRNTGEPPKRTITLAPDAGYSGSVKIIHVLFDEVPPNDAGHLRAAGIGEIGGAIGDPPINGIDAFARASDFSDIYHMIQTEKPCYLYYILQGGVEIPTAQVTSDIQLEYWILYTSFAPYLGEGEPIGEGPADYLP
jgi:hypothetical protein